jgi:hypothetical protein
MRIVVYACRPHLLVPDWNEHSLTNDRLVDSQILRFSHRHMHNEPQCKKEKENSHHVRKSSDQGQDVESVNNFYANHDASSAEMYTSMCVCVCVCGMKRIRFDVSE